MPDNNVHYGREVLLALFFNVLFITGVFCGILRANSAMNLAVRAKIKEELSLADKENQFDSFEIESEQIFVNIMFTNV